MEIPGAAMTFLCRPGGSAQIGIGGVSNRGDAIGFWVDRQAYGLPFTARNGVLLTDAPAGSHLLRALMSGGAVHVADERTGRRVSFPLSGSGGAIRQALAGCGLRP